MFYCDVSMYNGLTGHSFHLVQAEDHVRRPPDHRDLVHELHLVQQGHVEHPGADPSQKKKREQNQEPEQNRHFTELFWALKQNRKIDILIGENDLGRDRISVSLG